MVADKDRVVMPMSLADGKRMTLSLDEQVALWQMGNEPWAVGHWVATCRRWDRDCAGGGGGWWLAVGHRLRRRGWRWSV